MRRGHARVGERCLRVGSVALALAALAACSPSPNQPPEIRIGLLALLDGLQRETSGLPSVYGARMAVEEWEEKGGIELDGVKHRIRILVKPYENRPDSATSEARALINQDRIDALIGPQFSRYAIPVSIVAENAGVPMISPMSSSPATTKGKRFVFRLAFLDEFQASVMARFATGELGAERVAVLYDVSTAYGRNLAEVFVRTVEEAGSRIVALESFTRDGPLDFSTQMIRIQKAHPDALYLPNDTGTVRAQILQAREHGIEATLLGGDTWDMELFKTIPESEGAFVAHQWHYELPTPEARQFVERYQKLHDALPKVTTAMTYDAIRHLLLTIERQGSKDPDAIRSGLASTEELTGTTGKIRFAGKPDPERSLVISQIGKGSSKLYRVIDPKGTE